MEFLSVDDIRKIIAEHFSVSEDKVTVVVSEECVDMDQMHFECVPLAIVLKDS